MGHLFTWQFGVPVGLTMVYLLLVLAFLVDRIRFTKLTFFGTTLLYVLGVRLFDVHYLSSNPDLDQWIICAKSLVDDPMVWIKEYSLFDFTRVLTILPLALSYFVFGTLGYAEGHVFFLFFFFLILYGQFRFLNQLFTFQSVVISVALLSIYISLSMHHDYRIVNSEMVGIALLSWFFTEWINPGKRYILLGVILGLIPFAKEQMLFIALALYFCVFIFLIAKRQNLGMIKMIVGGFLGGGIWMVFILWVHGIDHLKWFSGVIVHYSQNGIRGSVDTLYDQLRLFLQLVWMNKEMIALFPLMLLGFVFSMYARFFSSDKWIRSNNETLVLQWLMLIVAIYSIYTPHNRSIHYNILLWISILFFTAYLSERLTALQRPSIILVSVVVFCLPVFWDFYTGRCRPWYDDDKISEQKLEWESEEYVKALDRLEVSGKTLMIWGWDNKYFVFRDSKRCSGYLYPQFAYGDFLEVKNVREYYLTTVQQKSPEFILELVGSNRWYFSDIESFGIEQSFPALYKELLKHYELKSFGRGFKLYQHN